jgi:hypothetical protein
VAEPTPVRTGTDSTGRRGRNAVKSGQAIPKA